MAKKYVVYQVWEELYGEHLSEQNIRLGNFEAEFDHEDDVVAYICDRIKDDHERINKLFEGDRAVRTFELNPEKLRADKCADSWKHLKRDDDHCDVVVSYCYEIVE